MAGTEKGEIWHLERENQEPLGWCLRSPPQPGVQIDCIAASDQVVVAAYNNGNLGVMRMDTPFVLS